MTEFHVPISPLLQALLAGLFTWGMTALGAALVFSTRRPSRRMLDAMLGFAAGVMIAASFWSLLDPAIALSAELGMVPWLPPALGFLAGGATLAVIDRVLPHLHPFLPQSQKEGLSTGWQRTTLLVLAITLHNIPEGLAVGVAFGAAGNLGAESAFGAAVALAIGIGIQNFPEGAAVALPLGAEGMSRRRAFWFGQLSAVVEPIAAVIGAAVVTVARPALPFALSFAAGAMLFVVIEELIPESQRGGNTDLATAMTIIGFTVMMILDLALG
jgi:ZIP family zinc transporter